MIVGLYPPSTGNAYIMGYNLRTQLDRIRSTIGFCPQVDILYENFTIKEHLELIASVSYWFYFYYKMTLVLKGCCVFNYSISIFLLRFQFLKRF